MFDHTSAEPFAICCCSCRRESCCLRQLFASWEFSSTCSDVAKRSHVSRTVSGCFAVLRSTAASDVQCPTLCSILWSCGWLYHASTTATQHLQGFLRPSSVDFSRSSSSPPSIVARENDNVISTLRDLHWLPSPERSARFPKSARFGATVSLRLHSVSR